MQYKSLNEEWPFEHECVWLRYTKDGVNYIEEVVNEINIPKIDSMGIPDWRPIDPPEWISPYHREIIEAKKRPRIYEEET